MRNGVQIGLGEGDRYVMGGEKGCDCCRQRGGKTEQPSHAAAWGCSGQLSGGSLRTQKTDLVFVMILAKRFRLNRELLAATALMIEKDAVKLGDPS